jgi:hypothetical protein
MCGSLKLERTKYDVKMRGSIPALCLDSNPFNRNDYKWDGFARADGSADGTKSIGEQWPANEWAVTFINAESFIETNRQTKRNYTFMAKKIACLVNSEGQLKILTLTSKTDVERSASNRMPVQLPTGWTVDKFIRTLNVKYGCVYELSQREIPEEPF